MFTCSAVVYCSPCTQYDAGVTSTKNKVIKTRICVVCIITILHVLNINAWPGSSAGIATELLAGRSGIESRWGRDVPPVQTGPGAHPASCIIGTGSFPGVEATGAWD